MKMDVLEMKNAVKSKRVNKWKHFKYNHISLCSDETQNMLTEVEAQLQERDLISIEVFVVKLYQRGL